MIHSPGVLEVLKAAPLFRGIPSDFLVDHLGKSRLLSLTIGETLLAPGQANDTIYIILSGRMKIQSRISNTEALAILGEGECVGEMSVLGGAPVSAYAVAASDCTLLAIGHIALWELINTSHKAAHNMLNILTERIRHINEALTESLEREQGFGGSKVDELTGLYNRRWTRERFERLLLRGIKDKKTNCVLTLEMDQFNEFNDRYGQLGSDQALRNIAHTMLSCLRPDDHAGRHVGEQFVAVLPNTPLEEACIAAERLRQAVKDSLVVLPSGDALPSVSVSLGLTQVRPDDTLVRLFARTDKALRMAKENGGNCVKLVE